MVQQWSTAFRIASRHSQGYACCAVLQDVVADSSYLKPFLNAQTKYYDTQIGDSTSLYFRNIDQSEPAQQAKMLQVGVLSSYHDFFNIDIFCASLAVVMRACGRLWYTCHQHTTPLAVLLIMFSFGHAAQRCNSTGCVLLPFRR